MSKPKTFRPWNLEQTLLLPLPMVERIVANTGQLPDQLIADAGYCSTGNIETCEPRKLKAYLSTSRQQHGKRPRSSRGPTPRDLEAQGRMDRKLRSKAGQAIYALCKTIVEPVFGQIKAARDLDRFLLRGLEKVKGEWHLIAITPTTSACCTGQRCREPERGIEGREPSLSQSQASKSPGRSLGELARGMAVCETNSWQSQWSMLP